MSSRVYRECLGGFEKYPSYEEFRPGRNFKQSSRCNSRVTTKVIGLDLGRKSYRCEIEKYIARCSCYGYVTGSQEEYNA